MKRALVAFALLFVCLPASAEPTEADKDAARILFTEAKELRDAGKLPAALERYKRAYDLAPTPITTLELARTHAMLGHLVEARRLYRSVETIEKKADESPKTAAARDEAKQLATDLDARIPTVVVKVVPEGPIDSALLDGKPLEVAQLEKPLALDPGKHVLTVRAKTEATVTVTVAEKERDRVVTIELPKPEVVPPKPPPPVVPPPPLPEVRSSWPGTMRWIGVIAGGAGLVVGAGAGALALSKASDVKSGCTGGVCPPSHHDDLDSTRRWATISTVGFSVAAVGATLFVIGLASGSGSESPQKSVAAPSIVPYASLDGLGLTGHF
ncbi:MAG: tetratricopeptide repeat protein [Polyangiales bacterium]